MPLDEITEFAKKNSYFRWIEITGGEPFMRSDIVDIVDAFRQSSKGLYLLDMPTNSLSDEVMVARKIGQMLELGIPRVIITLSLDGYRELHDTIRGVRGNFDKVMAMAKRLKELQKEYRGLSFSFGYTMSKYNQGALERTYQAVKSELGDVTYNDFHVNMGQISSVYYNNTGAAMDGDHLAMAEELGAFISKRKAGFGAMQMIENAFLRRLVYYMRTGKQPIRSRSLDASLFVDSYGSVYPSIMWDRRLGSIRDTAYDLEPILHGKKADDVRALIREGKEPVCWTACEAYQSIAGNLKSMLLP